jgi:hypothetical protein
MRLQNVAMIYRSPRRACMGTKGSKKRIYKFMNTSENISKSGPTGYCNCANGFNRVHIDSQGVHGPHRTYTEPIRRTPEPQGANGLLWRARDQ